MRTYKEMAQRVLKRRDEYEERKQNRKAGHGTVSAIIAASIMVVVILLGTIIGGVLKKPLLAPETDAPPAASSVEADKETMEKTTETGTETESVADVTEAQSGNQNDNEYHSMIEFVPGQNVQFVIDRNNIPDVYSFECKDVITREFNYYSRRYYGVPGGNRVRILILHSKSIELLSSDVLTLDISENDFVSFEIMFRYTEEKTSGGLTIYCIEDTNGDIDNDFTSAEDFASDLPELKREDIYNYFVVREYCAVRTKNHDFFARDAAISNLYYSIAVYYGYVNDDGEPLYYSNPYLPDYYDCQVCVELRQSEKEREEYHTLHSQNSIEREQTRDNTIYVLGFVSWEDSQGNEHPAKNLTACADMRQKPTEIRISFLTSAGFYCL